MKNFAETQVKSSIEGKKNIKYSVASTVAWVLSDQFLYKKSARI